MAMIDLYKNDYNVKYAHESDTCVYCVRELMRNQGIDEVEAKKKLEGAITGERIWFLGGADNIAVCKEHVKKICKEVSLDDEEDDE